MNLNFSQSTGLITKDDGSHVALGWAGNHEGKANPDMQDRPSLGPLPQHVYEIQPWEIRHDHLGPMVAFLKPSDKDPRPMFGRGDFFIHGPSMDQATYGQESKGCVVIPHTGRQLVHDLTPGPGDTLTVTA